MFYALNWFVVVSLFILWSLAAWAFHSIATWTVAEIEQAPPSLAVLSFRDGR